jgi:hypothetical protein
MDLTTSHDLARRTVPVLWSMVLSRLALSVLALLFTVRWQTLINESIYLSSPTTVLSHAHWVSRAAAVVLLVIWFGLSLTTRLDPGWQQTVRRRRILGRPPVGPGLTTASLAQLTGVAAGFTAVSVGLLLVAEPLPEYLGSLTYLGDPAYPVDLGPVVRLQVATVAILAVGVLAVGTPAAVGRTLLLASTAGLAAGLVTIGLINYRLSGLRLEHMLGLVLIWVLAMLAVGGLAATSVWYRLRQRLVGLARRRRSPG